MLRVVPETSMLAGLFVQHAGSSMFTCTTSCAIGGTTVNDESIHLMLTTDYAQLGGSRWLVTVSHEQTYHISATSDGTDCPDDIQHWRVWDHHTLRSEQSISFVCTQPAIATVEEPETTHVPPLPFTSSSPLFRHHDTILAMAGFAWLLLNLLLIVCMCQSRFSGICRARRRIRRLKLRESPATMAPSGGSQMLARKPRENLPAASEANDAPAESQEKPDVPSRSPSRSPSGGSYPSPLLLPTTTAFTSGVVAMGTFCEWVHHHARRGTGGRPHERSEHSSSSEADRETPSATDEEAGFEAGRPCTHAGWRASCRRYTASVSGSRRQSVSGTGAGAALVPCKGTEGASGMTARIMEQDCSACCSGRHFGRGPRRASRERVGRRQGKTMSHPLDLPMPLPRDLPTIEGSPLMEAPSPEHHYPRQHPDQAVQVTAVCSTNIVGCRSRAEHLSEEQPCCIAGWPSDQRRGRPRELFPEAEPAPDLEGNGWI